jgi:hypothetical protein
MPGRKNPPAKTKKKQSGKKRDNKKPDNKKSTDPFTTVKFSGQIENYKVKPGKTPEVQRLIVVCDFDLTAFGVITLPDLARLTKGKTIQCTFVDTMPELPFKSDDAKKDEDQGNLNLDGKKDDANKRTAATRES